MFFDQFEWDGPRILYRKDNRAAGVPVSEDERDAFVAAFRRGSRRAGWGLLGALLPGGIAFAAAVRATVAGPSWPYVYGYVGACFAGYLLAWRRLWTAPERALRDRPRTGVDRTAAEMRARRTRRESWKTIVRDGAGLGIFFLQAFATHDVWHGWGRLWVMLFALAAGLYARQIVARLQADGAA